MVRLTYVGMIAGEPRLDEEHEDFGWFSREELEELEGLDPFLREVLAARKCDFSNNC